MSSPAVTVLIPTFNWSTVLPYSIGSALKQTMADFELLVIGDGCTDDSEQVVRGILDPRVRWINLPVNTGHQSGPNNEGLRQARGDVIAYLGHDDLWLPHHLECLLAGLAAGADLAFGVTATIAENGQAVPAMLGPYRPGMWMPPTGVIHSRTLAERIGGWRDHRDLRVDPEVDLWQRAFDASRGFAFVQRLTALKFPASQRRNVYRQRPCHEQAAWSERIQANPQCEANQLVRMLSTVYGMKAVSATSAQSPPQVWEPGEQVRSRRAFKGLDNPPD